MKCPGDSGRKYTPSGLMSKGKVLCATEESSFSTSGSSCTCTRKMLRFLGKTGSTKSDSRASTSEEKLPHAFTVTSPCSDWPLVSLTTGRSP